jgi:hypothetical protein
MGVTDREITPFSLPSLGSMGQESAHSKFANSKDEELCSIHELFVPSFQDIVVTEEEVQDQGWWWISAASDFMVESECKRPWFQFTFVGVSKCRQPL